MATIRMVGAALLSLASLVNCIAQQSEAGSGEFASLKEVNRPSDPGPDAVVAIIGARLIDGNGNAPIPEATVIVRGPRIAAAGPSDTTPVPAGAEIIDARGMSVLPGLVDTHYHNDNADPSNALIGLVLSRGVTTLRDPGLPIDDYVHVRASKRPMPRCFLTGKHLDQEPHAYPHDAITVNSPDEVRSAVARHIADGGSALKVYFRLPLDLIEVACATAHERKIPVTAHLELVDADDAIRAGLDGVEHVTSFGTALAAPEAAEEFRAAVRADNDARRDGRYRLWSTLDLEQGPRVRSLIDLIASRKVVLSPTLAVFERRTGDKDTGEHHVRGFENMLRFVGLCRAAGAPIVVGSHTSVPHAGRGWAYHRELELLVESGLTPAQAIVAATSQGARFLGCADRLGTIEPGKLADLIIVEGDPVADITAMRSVRHVMQNGRWVGDPPEGPVGRTNETE